MHVAGEVELFVKIFRHKRIIDFIFHDIIIRYLFIDGEIGHRDARGIAFGKNGTALHCICVLPL